MPKEFTLSSGEVVLLRDKNTSKKYATGTKHPTKNWGDVEVIGQVAGKDSSGKYGNFVILFTGGYTKIGSCQQLRVKSLIGDIRCVTKENKICWRCKKEKNIKSEFYSGRNYCITCCQEARKVYTKKNRKKINKYNKNKMRQYRKQNPLHKLRYSMGINLGINLKKVITYKPSSTMEYVGTTKEKTPSTPKQRRVHYGRLYEEHQRQYTIPYRSYYTF